MEKRAGHADPKCSSFCALGQPICVSQPRLGAGSDFPPTPFHKVVSVVSVSVPSDGTPSVKHFLTRPVWTSS